MTYMRQMTWTPPIPAGSTSKYTPTFMGSIAATWTPDAILAESTSLPSPARLHTRTEAANDVMIGNKLQAQYPVYCLYKSVPYVGMAAPSDSTNCYDYADKLWSIISK
jgi:hypothetical protein